MERVVVLDHAVTSVTFHRKSVPSTHMRCRMTASLAYCSMYGGQIHGEYLSCASPAGDYCPAIVEGWLAGITVSYFYRCGVENRARDRL